MSARDRTEKLGWLSRCMMQVSRWQTNEARVREAGSEKFDTVAKRAELYGLNQVKQIKLRGFEQRNTQNAKCGKELPNV
jgi:hypothetical protein